MATKRTPGPLTSEPDSHDQATFRSGSASAMSGPVGLYDDSTELNSGKRVTRVTKDWTDPPAVNRTDSTKITATTLKAVLVELNKLPLWGTGGGNITGTGEDGEIMALPIGNDRYSIELVGKFFTTLPKWMNYGSATEAQKKSWDNMIHTLKEHEDEHVRIAHTSANKLVRELTGIDVMNAAQKVADNKAETKAAQVDFDSEEKTDHGRKAWGRFKVVFLDTSVDP